MPGFPTERIPALELRHLNCHNKSAANVSVLLWKQWGGLLVSLVSPQPDSIYDTIVWLVSRENYFMAFQFMFPLCTSTAFLSTLSPCWKFKCSSWPPYWNLSWWLPNGKWLPPFELYISRALWCRWVVNKWTCNIFFELGSKLGSEL